MPDLKEIKVVIKGILGSSKKQMLQKDLIREFYDTVGYRIPHNQFGFRSCEEFLRSLTDTCLLVGNGPFAQVTPILTSDSAHIVQMIAKQRDNTKTRDKYKPRNQAIIVPAGPAHSSVAVPRPIAAISHPPQTRHFQLQSAPQFPRIRPQVQHSQHLRPPPLMSINPNTILVNHRQSPQTISPFQHALFRPRPLLPPRRMNQMSAIGQRLQQKPGPNQLPNSNKCTINSTSTISKPSINTKEDMSQQKNEETTEKASKTNEETFDGDKSSAIHPYNEKTLEGHKTKSMQTKENIENESEEYNLGLSPPMTPNIKINYRVPKVIQENLRNLIIKHPEGLWLRQMQQAYRDTFNESLEFFRYGYSSLVEMCLSMSYIFCYRQLQADDGKLYHVDAPMLAEIDDAMLDLAREMRHMAAVDEQENLPHLDAIPKLTPVGGDYPPFVMLPGDKIPEVEVPNCEEQLYVRMYIEEVYDLSKFWFSLADNELTRDNNSRDIEEFYNANYQKFAITQDQLAKGLFVILYKAMDNYRRAVVVRYDKTMVKVFCVDFGTVESTSVENLFFMHRDFGDYPRQAVRARLARLMPPVKQGQWSRDAAYRLVELVRSKLLHGSVDCTDDSQGDLIHDLVLCDASNEADIFIHDVLIAEGFAIPVAQEQVAPSADLYGDFVPIVNDLHLYPSFIELELAVVPTAMEMRSLVCLNIPLPEIYPIYFKKKEQPTDADGESEQRPLRRFMQRSLLSSEKEVTTSQSSTSSKSETDSMPRMDTISAKSTSGFDLNLLPALDTKLELSIRPYQPIIAKLPETNSFMSLTSGPSSPLENLTMYDAPMRPAASLGSRPDFVDFNENPAGFHEKLDTLNNVHDGLDDSVEHVRSCNFYDHSATSPRPEADVASSFLSSVASVPSMGGGVRTVPSVPPGFAPLPADNANFIFRELPHGNRMLEQMTAQVYNTVQQQISQQIAQQMRNEYQFMSQPMPYGPNAHQIAPWLMNPQGRKKYVTETAIFGRTMHIIRIMKLPCVLTSEVQLVFTGKIDSVLLRRYVSMTDVIVSVLPLDGLNEQFRLELTQKNLILNKTQLHYTRLDSLEELISCLTNTVCTVPNFNKMVESYADSSPVWSMN